MDSVRHQVINAFERLTHTDRPGHWRTLYIQYCLDLIQYFDVIADFTVHLVDKGKNRRVAQTAYVHQLDGPVFYTFSAVNHHQYRVNSGQSAVSIF